MSLLSRRIGGGCSTQLRLGTCSLPGPRSTTPLSQTHARTKNIRIQEGDAAGDAALVAKIHAAINLPLGVDPDEEGAAEGDDGDAAMEGGVAARDALLRGALAGCAFGGEGGSFMVAVCCCCGRRYGGGASVAAACKRQSSP